MGPERGGGVGGCSGVRGLVYIAGVGGGETRVAVEDAGLVIDGEVDPLLMGKRSG